MNSINFSLSTKRDIRSLRSVAQHSEMSLLTRVLEEQYDAVGTAESNPFLFFLLCLLDMPTARKTIPFLFPKGSLAITAWIDQNCEPLNSLHRLVEEHEVGEFQELRGLLRAQPSMSTILMPPSHLVDILNHFYSDRVPDVPLLAVLKGSTKGMTKTQASEMAEWMQAKLEPLKQVEELLPGWDFYDFFSEIHSF